MTTTEMETRLTAVEREIAQLKEQFAYAPHEASQEFAALLEAFNKDTLLLSDQARILTHWAYLRIIGLGNSALPHILHDLQAGGGPWFAALQAITGQNPVPEEHARSVQLMRQDWLAWGQAKGYVRE